MSDPNSLHRRPSAGSRSLIQSIRNASPGNRMSHKFFEARVGEPWSTRAKLLLKNKLGLVSSVQGSTYNKVAKAKVLVFTGHHWVRHGGNPGEFRPMDRRGQRIKTSGVDLSKVMRTTIAGMRLELVSYNAKLIIVSGCYTLQKKSAKWFHSTFPNATVLGFFGSAPVKKGNFYESFLERLPNTIDVDSKQSVNIIIDTWKKQIEEADTERDLWKGGSSDPTNRKPGYMTKDGNIFIWKKHSKQWDKLSY